MLDLQPSIEMLSDLIGFPTVSSTSNTAISSHVASLLIDRGFDVETTHYTDPTGVQKTNLVAKRESGGNATASSKQQVAADHVADKAEGGVAYFCHTDVVPVANWTGPGGDAFTGHVTDDRIYGRGACDMKGSLVTMLAAVDRIDPADQTAPIWIVCTADEEVGFDGAKHLVQNSDAYRRLVIAQPVGIIGEPTSLEIVNAHKGITGFQITSIGKAAHSSTTEGVNANVAMVPMLQTLLELEQISLRDPAYQDPRFDPPTLSWNFGFADGGDAINITPGRCTAWVSLRPMPAIDGEDLIARAQAKSEALGLSFKRFAGGTPVWLDPNDKCIQTMCAVNQTEPKTVCYGTDGGEFRELRRLFVCGPGSITQAHTSDEFLTLDQLQRGIELYRKAIIEFACS